MGCDIHSFAEVRNKQTNKWEKVGNHFSLDDFRKEYYKKDKGENPFDWRCYAMFGFLADVRNYSHCEPIADLRGIPDDTSSEVREEYQQWEGDAHSASHLLLKELSDYDYDKTFWDRRVTKQISPNGWNGAALADEGEGAVITYREHLGEQFFQHLEELKTLGSPEDVRFVFWFDN